MLIYPRYDLYAPANNLVKPICMLKALVSLIIFLLISAAVLLSCSKSGSGTGNTNVCTGVTRNFSSDVNPIIQSFCNKSGCHGPGSVNGPGPLTNYQQVFDARARIRTQVAAGLMPQDATLTTTQKNTIICWIDNGADNN